MNVTRSDARIVNVTLRNVSIAMSGGGQKTDAAASANYTGPDLSGNSVAPSYGLFLRNLHHSTVDGLSLSFEDNDDRPALILEHCCDVVFREALP